MKEAEWTHTLDNEHFVDVVRRYGFIPEQALAQQDLLELMLPAFKADISLHEKYNFVDGEKLQCPIAAYGGEDDASVTETDLHAWKTVTASSFECKMFAGGHFYTAEHADLLLTVVRDRLQAAFDALPLSMLEGPFVDYPDKEKCVHMLVEDQARKYPDVECIFGLERTLTYARLMVSDLQTCIQIASAI